MGFRLLSAMCRMMRGVAGSRLKAEVNREESPCGKAVIHKFNRSGCLRFYIEKKYYRITWAINVRSSSILHLIVRVVLHTFFYNVAVRCLAWYKLQRRLFMHHMTFYVWFITNVRTHVRHIIKLSRTVLLQRFSSSNGKREKFLHTIAARVEREEPIRIRTRKLIFKLLWQSAVPRARARAYIFIYNSL